MINKQWVPVMYNTQGYPDNYTHNSFFKKYTPHYYQCPYTYFELTMGCLNIAQAFNILASFLFFYNLLLSNSFSDLLKITFICTSIALYYIIYLKSNHTHLKLGNVVDGLMILFFLYFFTPLLHKLAITIATDTTILITCILIIFYFLYYDYSMQQSIEMNWSFRIMFVASVFMGSRLSTIADMFCLLVIELLAFGCRIFTRTLIIKKSKNAYTRIILLQSIFNLCLIGKAQMRLMMYAYVLIEVFIVLLVPYIYLAAYKHKRY